MCVLFIWKNCLACVDCRYDVDRYISICCIYIWYMCIYIYIKSHIWSVDLQMGGSLKADVSNWFYILWCTRYIGGGLTEDESRPFFTHLWWREGRYSWNPTTTNDKPHFQVGWNLKMQIWVVATQIFFMFTPIWGRFPIWQIFFRWVETTNWRCLFP